jgi:histidyl-tRNA synthetase
VQTLREGGYSVDYALAPAKVGKQFQAAEQLGARVAILFGDEWPQLKVKDLRSGEQCLVAQEQVAAKLAALLRP